MTTLNSLDDLEDQIRNFSESLQNFGLRIDGVGNNLTTDAQRNSSLQNRIRAEDKEWHEKSQRAVANTITGLTNFSRQLSSSPGNFSNLNKAVDLTSKTLGAMVGKIPFVGGALKGLAEGAGEAAKFMIDSFQSAYGTFEKLSESGVVVSFGDLRRASDSLGMTFADTERVLSKASKDLANFGGSAVAGRKIFEEIGESSMGMRLEFQKMGMSVADFREAQLGYIGQQTRLGRIQNRSVSEISESSGTYIKQLDLLSKVTGLQRKDIQAQRDAALSETRFRAGLEGLDLPEKLKEQVQNAAQDLNTIIQKQSPELAQGFRDLFTGLPTTDAAKQLVLQTDGAATEIIDKLRAGTITQFEADKQLRQAVANTIPKFNQLAKATGDATLLTKGYPQALDYSRGKSIENADELAKLTKEIEANRQASDDQNAALAKTKLALNDAAKNIEQIATSSTLVTKAMSVMATGIEAFTEWLYEKTGQKLPAHMQARKEERKSQESVTEQKEKVQKIDQELVTVTKSKERVDDLSKKIEELTKAQEAIKLESRSTNLNISKERRQQLDEEFKKNAEELQKMRSESAGLSSDYQKYSVLQKQKTEEEQKLIDLQRKSFKASESRMEAEKKAGATRLNADQDEAILMAARNFDIEAAKKEENKWNEKLSTAKKALETAIEAEAKAQKEASTGVRKGEATLMPQYDRQYQAKLAKEALEKAKSQYEGVERGAALAKQQVGVAESKKGNVTSELSKLTGKSEQELKLAEIDRQSKSQIEKLKNNNEKLTATLENKNTDYTKVEEELKLRREQLKEAKDQAELDTVNARIKELEGKRTATKKELEEAQKAVIAARKELEDAQRDVEYKKNQVKSQDSGTAQSGLGTGQVGSGASVKDVIAGKESAGSYNIMAGERKGKEKNKLTEMSIDDVVKLQKSLPSANRAAGKYQFMPQTLETLATKYKIDKNTKFDEATQEKLQDYLLEENKASLEKAGEKATPGNMYLTHFLGASGASVFLKKLREDPNAPVSKGMSKAAMDNNARIAYKDQATKTERTLAEVYDMMAGDVDRKYAAAQQNKPTTTAQARPNIPQASDGGILSGSKSGFLATLHGTEAVVPLPDGKTIPVKLDSDPLKEMSSVLTELANMPTIVSKSMTKNQGDLAEKVGDTIAIKLASSLIPGFDKLSRVASMVDKAVEMRDKSTGQQLLEIAKMINPTVRILATLYEYVKKETPGKKQTEITETTAQEQTTKPMQPPPADMPQAADGGILSGSKSGFLATLHGTEAVVPLPDGKTIPVKLDGDPLKEMSNALNELSRLPTTLSRNITQDQGVIVEKIGDKVAMKLASSLVPGFDKLTKLANTVDTIAGIKDKSTGEQLLEVAKMINPTVRILATLYDFAKPYIQNSRVAGAAPTELPKTPDNEKLNTPIIADAFKEAMQDNITSMNAANTKTGEKFDQMANAFQSMTEKLSEAVDVLQSSKNIQKNLLATSMN
jgi:hypothetical protein